MKQIGVITIAVLAIGVANGAKAQDCNRSAIDQSSINACAHVDWKIADRDLNRAYKQAKAAAQRMDEYLDDGQVPVAKMLRDAQRAWIPFRDQACAVESTSMRGGSAQPLLLWGCMTRLTRQRTEDLRNFADVN